MNSLLMRATAIVLSLAATACSIHPMTEDYAGVATPDIVRQVRCEARSALADSVRYWLESFNKRALAARFPSDPRQPMSFSDNLFPPEFLPIVQKFENSAIAYDFTFDMTEVDNFDATLDLLAILRHTIGSAGLSGGIDRTRENIRTFTITDTFSGLLNMIDPGGKDGYCRKYVLVGDMTYPITGKIGLDKVFHNFIDLSLFSNLGDPGHKEGPPATAEALTFTTKLSGSLNPKVVLGQAYRGTQVADASLNATTSRVDVHKLIVGLALPAPRKPEKAPSAPKNSEATGTFVTASATTDAEIAAVKKIDQFIFRFEIGRATAITAISP